MNFYFEGARVLDRLDSKEGSIKGILATLPEKDRKRTAALVIETLKYKPVLKDVLDKVDLLRQEKKITSLNLALVLVHDIILDKGIQAGAGPVKNAILRHKTRLQAEFVKVKIKRGAASNVELAEVGDARAARIPRYVRVNTTMWTTEEAIEFYVVQGFSLTGPFEHSKGFAVDEHIPDLLLFSPHLSFHEDDAYLKGKVILQDKASCFPASVLAPPAHEDAVVLDATAAPGNKTTHLSMLMRNHGKLYALERDRKRFSTLEMMLEKAGCKNVTALNKDFLEVDPHESKYSACTHILLDPSCSGSGIVNRLDYLLDKEEENVEVQNDRLNKLAAFQLLMIRHAMKFPAVERIVYSTCSIHATENENVVAAALNSDEATCGHFVLAPRSDVLPAWHRRGLPEEMLSAADAQSLIRCSPGEDSTNGFFVSCFVRAATGANETLHKRKLGDESEGGVENARVNKKRKKKKKYKNVRPA